MAKLEDRRGNADTADAVRAQAGEIVAYIADHASSEELCTSFLSLPEVKSILAKLCGFRVACNS